jgi:hypothetical protein
MTRHTVIYSNSWRVSIIKLGTNLPFIGLRSLSRRFFSKIVEIIIWRDILTHLFGTTRKCCNDHSLSDNMACSSRKPLLEQQRLFSLKTWRKAEKRSTEIEKLRVLLTWFSLAVFNSSVCATYSSPLKKIETLILTRFLQTTLLFLFSTRLRPPTMREKLSKMCQKTVDFETQKMVDGDARLITTEAVGEDCLWRMKECA